jgi:hypothetical protein
MERKHYSLIPSSLAGTEVAYNYIIYSFTYGCRKYSFIRGSQTANQHEMNPVIIFVVIQVIRSSNIKENETSFWV